MASDRPAEAIKKIPKAIALEDLRKYMNSSSILTNDSLELGVTPKKNNAYGHPQTMAKPHKKDPRRRSPSKIPLHKIFLESPYPLEILGNLESGKFTGCPYLPPHPPNWGTCFPFFPEGKRGLGKYAPRRSPSPVYRPRPTPRIMWGGCEH